ncbi:MAG: hypothetical protein ACE1ZX_06060 [Acidimicrobiia bacterium]|jgi:hypothetical protein
MLFWTEGFYHRRPVRHRLNVTTASVLLGSRGSSGIVSPCSCTIRRQRNRGESAYAAFLPTR